MAGLMKIGLVTDSNSDIDFDYAEKHNIKVVPLNVSYNGKEYVEDRDFVENELADYYRQFENQDLFVVKTSQPSPDAFVTAYKELVEEGYDAIIGLIVSSGLSGTFNSARLASLEVMDEHGVDIRLVDSRSASAGTFYLVEKALELVKAGRTDLDKMVAEIEAHRKHITTILNLPTLKYLRAGGRISATRFFLGKLLRLKPIIKTKRDGTNERIGSSKSMEEGNRNVYNLTTKDGTRLANCYSIDHCNAPERAEHMESIIREKQPDVEVRHVLTRSSISAHTGPGGLALIARFDDPVEDY